MSAQYPLEMVSTPSGPMIRLLDGEFWAVLTACSSSSSSSPTSSSCRAGQQPCPYGPAYCWAEVQTTGQGVFTIFQGNRTSGPLDANGIPLQPAYEVNGACIYPGTIVRLRRGYASEYLIDHCCTVGQPVIVCSSSSSSSSPASSPASSQPSSSSSSSQPSSSTASSSQPSSTTAGSRQPKSKTASSQPEI